MAQEFTSNKFYCDVDTSDRKLAKKIREAELAHYNCILVVGEAEQKEKTANLREGTPPTQTNHKMEELLKIFEERRSKFQ